MRGRDPLLGQVSHGQPSSRRGAPVALIAAIAIVAVLAILFFVAGIWWSARNVPVAERPLAASVPPPPAPASVKVGPTPASQLSARPVPAFLLKPLTEADSEKIGAGCRCSFYPRGGKSEILGAGGEDLAIFRPDGVRQICPLKEDALQAMFDGDARIECGQSRLRVKETGSRRPGLDGHSSAARLIVTYAGAERAIEGSWGCFC